MTSKAESQPGRGPYSYWDTLTSDQIRGFDRLLLRFPDQYTLNTVEGKPGDSFRRMTFIKSNTSQEILSSMYIQENFDGTYKVALDAETAKRLGNSLGPPNWRTDDVKSG